MHKLTNMEAQRVIAVLDDAVDKLGSLGYVPSSPDGALAARAAAQGRPTLKACLQRQWQCEEAAEVLRKAKNAGQPGVAAFDASDELAECTRSLCRELKADAAALQMLRDYDAANASNGPECVSALSSLNGLPVEGLWQCSCVRSSIETAPWGGASRRPLSTAPFDGHSKRRLETAHRDGASKRPLETAP
ncbi:hypothetical protein M885DRAFT_67401 [Pelagophyceae sp. CCMP2097]|nr:hypothetical protein M885DRAFT_67401 [Pelagophyceae sp. CCMP2097]